MQFYQLSNRRRNWTWELIVGKTTFILNLEKKYSEVKPVNCPIEAGIEPMSWLIERSLLILNLENNYRSLKFIKFPIEAGIAPESWLSLTELWF